MITSQCIITGANFIDVASNSYIHGDLFEFGAVYIFNAGQCTWTYGNPEELERNIYCANFFEKNKVIIFHKIEASLNTAALMYLEP